jgi:hypothetical protein
MSRPRRAAIAMATAVGLLAAGCGSAAPAGHGAGPAAPWSERSSLQTALITTAGTWAVTEMGYASGHNNFWQLFSRPAGGTRWQLVTPPGVADNGGLVLAGGGRSLIAAFRPSQYLAFTPLTATTDGGQSWSSQNPVDAALAGVPDALAAAPGSGQLLALLTDGTVRTAAPGGARWSTLASERSLAASAPGRGCGLLGLTATAFSPSGQPLLAGACGHPGTAGIFAYSAGSWHAAGPPLPATLARSTVSVLRLTTEAGRTVALLAAGTGAAASLLAAWTADGGRHWTLSPSLRLNGARVTSASFGPGGAAAIALSGNRGEALGGPGTAWRSLPALPPGTATLAAGPAGGFDALAAHRTTLTVWQLAPRSAAWARTQSINVPIQFGSSA